MTQTPHLGEEEGWMQPLPKGQSHEDNPELCTLGLPGQGVSPGLLEQGRAVLKASPCRKLQSKGTSLLGARGGAGLGFEKKSLCDVSAL